MSYLALLIGFKYSDEKELPSTIIDLIKVNTFVSKGDGFVVMLSDIEDIKSKIEGVSHIPIYSKNNLEQAIRSLNIQNETKMVVYYTGHGEVDSKMLLPNGELYPLLEFRNLITSLCKENIEILFIIDCCYSGTLGLPYILTEDTCNFKLLPNINYILKNKHSFILQSVICLSSSMRSQKSASVDNKGSLFTNYLIDACMSGVLNLSTISKIVRSKIMGDNLNSNQSMILTSSYPIPPILWTWVTNPKVNIYINDPTSTLILELTPNL